MNEQTKIAKLRAITSRIERCLDEGCLLDDLEERDYLLFLDKIENGGGELSAAWSEASDAMDRYSRFCYQNSLESRMDDDDDPNGTMRDMFGEDGSDDGYDWSREDIDD